MIIPPIIGLVLWILLYMCATIYFFNARRRRVRVESMLLQRGVAGTGQIVGQVSSRVATTYLPYSYMCEEKKYTCRQLINRRDILTFQRGSSVHVLYLPDNPKIAMLEGMDFTQRESSILKKQAYKSLLLACIPLPLLMLLLINLH